MSDYLTKRTAFVHRLTGRFPHGLWREVLFEDVGLKLLALAITIGLWFGVTAQRAAPVIVHLRRVPLSFHVPNGIAVNNQSRATVDVTLKGSGQTLDELTAQDLSANVKVDRQIGTHIINLTTENLEVVLPNGTALPNDVRVERVNPESLTLEISAP